MDVSLYFRGPKYFGDELCMNKYWSLPLFNFSFYLWICSWLCTKHCQHPFFFCLIHSSTKHGTERLCSVSTLQPNKKQNDFVQTTKHRMEPLHSKSRTKPLRSRSTQKRTLPVCHFINNSFPNTTSTAIDQSWNHWRGLCFCVMCPCPF
jgi:hypothetical protein